MNVRQSASPGKPGTAGRLKRLPRQVLFLFHPLCRDKKRIAAARTEPFIRVVFTTVYSLFFSKKKVRWKYNKQEGRQIDCGRDVRCTSSDVHLWRLCDAGASHNNLLCRHLHRIILFVVALSTPLLPFDTKQTPSPTGFLVRWRVSRPWSHGFIRRTGIRKCLLRGLSSLSFFFSPPIPPAALLVFLSSF